MAFLEEMVIRVTFFDVCNKRFLNDIFIDKKVYALAPKKELSCVLPLIGKKIILINI